MDANQIRDEIASMSMEDLMAYADRVIKNCPFDKNLILREIPNGQTEQLDRPEGGTEWACYALPTVDAVCYGWTEYHAILSMWVLCGRLNVLIHP